MVDATGKETAKDVVLRFMDGIVAAMNSGDPDKIRGAMELFAEDSTFWLLGNLPFSGTLRGREEIMQKMYLPSLTRIARGTMSWQLRSVVAEGDQVVVEWTSQRKTADGRDFDNALIALFQVKNGKIVLMREYMDTQRTKEAYWPDQKTVGSR